MKKTAREIVKEAYEELERLDPTSEEIHAFANYKEQRKEAYGVVTYSKSEGRDRSFLRLHDTWKQKIGGRIHIDVGYVEREDVDEPRVPDTTHLMLDKCTAPEFVEFIRKRRSA